VDDLQFLEQTNKNEHTFLNVLAKVIVVYESKYGNTKLVAEKVIEGMRQVEGIETVLSEVKDVDFDKIINYAAILVGSPNHIGGPLEASRSLSISLGNSTWLKNGLLFLTRILERTSKKQCRRWRNE